MGSGINKNGLEYSIHDLLTDQADFASVVARPEDGEYDLPLQTATWWQRKSS